MLENQAKLFKSGNSNAVRLNKDISKALNVEAGDSLNVKYDPASKSVVITRSDTKLKVSPEFQKMFDQTYEENKEAMDLLKDV